MRCEVVAVGTELLLGQIIDTNSSWMGEQLAAAGIDSHYQTKVGDNLDRIVGALRIALSRSDAVICCGGLGPTQDDITREAIAIVMNVDLVRHDDIVETIRAMFQSRGREMSENNARQGDVPKGASIIAQTRGTAPGLVCPVGKKVIYAVPGVPYEMRDMFERVIVGDLVARSGATATWRRKSPFGRAPDRSDPYRSPAPGKSTSKSIAAKSGAERPSRKACFSFGRYARFFWQSDAEPM